jgi:hypothetical protein
MKQSNNILFLDHDGVICLETEWGSRTKKRKNWFGSYTSVLEMPVECRFDNFNQKAVRVLNLILEETDAEIVVSSDWRFKATLEELSDYYLSQGIKKAPISVTPQHKDCYIPPDFPWSRTFELEQSRSLEILQWLSDHKSEVINWVAVDDLHMGSYVENSTWGPHERDWGLDNFVWTPRSSEGIKQTGIKEKIIRFFKTV